MIGFPFPQESGVGSTISRSTTKTLTVDRWEDSKDAEEKALLFCIIPGATDEGDQRLHNTNHKALIVITKASSYRFFVPCYVIQKLLS
tara:strand:+ start:1023 stop:1286 length:264 start_codon:yes stop_codon:yes gene_type:complete